MKGGLPFAWRVGVAGLCLSVPLAASPSLARATDFHIAPQSLAKALTEFGLQSGASVVYSFPSASRMRSSGVVGRFDHAEALKRLLGGSGQFTVVPLVDGFVIKLAAEDPPYPTPGERASAALAAGSRDETGFAGDTILVTAQKRSERLLDVPMSISAITGGTMRAAGIGSTGGLQQVVPGLVTPSVGLAFTPAIRGVTTISTSPGDETNVAIYVDDVYIGAPIAGLFEFEDIERVEVLKGPQGTLFGRNATGGAIRVITKVPSDSLEGEFSAEHGFNFNRMKFGGYMSGPLGDGILGTFNFIHSQDDGYIKGVGPNVGHRFGKKRNNGVGAKIRYALAPDLAITIAGDASSRNDTGLYAWVPHNGHLVHGSNPETVIPEPFQYAGSTKPVADLEAYGVSMNVSWNRDNALSIRSITAYRSVFGSYQTDLDRINLSLGALRLKQSQRNFSHEFVVSTPSGRAVSLIGGLYYYHSRAFNPYFESHTTDSPNGPIAQNFTNNVFTNSYAAFGEATVELADRLDLTLGARYTTETKKIDFRFFVRAAGLLSAHDKETWKSPTFRGVIRYDIARDANIYFSASNGFKSGVFNAYAYPLMAVKPEKIDAFELGTKAKRGRITFSAAAFLYNYRNIQLQGQTQVGNIFDVSLINAAKAHIRGFEASFGGKIDRHLNFDLGISALPIAKYSNFTRAQVFVPNRVTGGNSNVVPYDATDSRMIRSPKYQGNISVIYNTNIAEGNFQGSINYAYNSGYYFQPGNFSFQKAYHIINTRLAWTDRSGRWTFSLTGQNLTNEIYSFYKTDSLVGTIDVLARPREFGAGVAVKL